jgi:hypothetical protein
MFALPWYSILLISIPQTIFSLLIGFQLFNLRVDFRKCLVVAIVVGIVTYLLRRTLVIPGIHTVLIILVMVISITLINRGGILYNFLAVMLGSMILGVIEGVWCPLFLSITSLAIRDLAIYPGLNIACFIPVLLLAVMIYILIRRHDFYIYNLDQKGTFR